MSEPEMDEISQIDAPQVTVSFKQLDVKLYSNDYQKYVSSPRARRSLKTRLIKLGWRGVYGLAVALLTAASAFVVDAITNDLFWMLATLLGGLIFWRYAVAFAWQRIATAMTWQRLRKSDFCALVQPLGLEVRSKRQTTTLFWPAIDDLIVTDSYFLFVSDEPSLYFCPVPRRCFQSRAEAGTFLKTATDLWKAAHRTADVG